MQLRETSLVPATEGRPFSGLCCNIPLVTAERGGGGGVRRGVTLCVWMRVLRVHSAALDVLCSFSCGRNSRCLNDATLLHRVGGGDALCLSNAVLRCLAPFPRLSVLPRLRLCLSASPLLLPLLSSCSSSPPSPHPPFLPGAAGSLRLCANRPGSSPGLSLPY